VVSLAERHRDAGKVQVVEAPMNEVDYLQKKGRAKGDLARRCHGEAILN